ncbi:hypothetical protein F5X71_34470 [Nocardia brasiliensis]|uniref:Uncharacterized protein n=1 Tax=Nocardia brasiliensis TaxID=37326 RepID=A0A6G9Y0Z3_NOCBR|nr:hypothetical protein [Nocardia brasiliensis]QIS06733.1 hypothetical protein F5X71_34470 [Nocardia brasiliensis]
MSSDHTAHQARAVGGDMWAVSYLPGWTVPGNQAVAAIKAAEVITYLQALADELGLTALEAAGLALQEPPWLIPPRVLRCAERSRSQDR